MTSVNKDGTQRRRPTDNKVIKYGGIVYYKGNKIDYDMSKKKWLLNDNEVGSISQLSIDLYVVTGDIEFKETTYKIGAYLEEKGYIFNTSFIDQYSS